MTYSKEDKKRYFEGLRKAWQEAKEKSAQDVDVQTKWQAINEQAGGKLSYVGFYFTYMSMQAQGLEGLPYVDAKTFEGWKNNGFMVKKGEHSTLSGITWIAVNPGESPENYDYLLPKEYHLFHRTQVESL